MAEQKTCPRCGGRKAAPRDPCERCGGTGVIYVEVEESAETAESPLDIKGL